MPLLEFLGPAIELAFRLLIGVAVTFLNQAEQLVALAFDDMDIVIRQIAPLRPDLAFKLRSNFLRSHPSS